MCDRNLSLGILGGHDDLLPTEGGKLERLTKAILKEIELSIKYGMDTIYFYTENSFDLLCAQTILKNKRLLETFFCSQIKITAIVNPHVGIDLEQFCYIINQCDNVIYKNFLEECHKVDYLLEECVKIICHISSDKLEEIEHTRKQLQKVNTLVNLYEL